MKTLILTEDEAQYLLDLVGKQPMGKTGRGCSIYEKLIDLGVRVPMSRLKKILSVVDVPITKGKE